MMQMYAVMSFSCIRPEGPMAFPTTKVAIKAGVGVWEMARV